MSNSSLYSDILGRIGAVRSKENRLALFYGILATVMLSLLLLLVTVVVEEVFSFGVPGRTLLFSAAALGFLGVSVWFVLRPILRLAGILRTAGTAEIAQRVGDHFPQVRDRLLDAIQMYEEREKLKSSYSVELIDASFSDLHRQIESLVFTEAVQDSAVRKMGKTVLFAFGIFILTFVVSPSGFLGSLYRIANYNVSFASPLPVRFVIEPGNADVVRGQTVPITIRTEGRPVEGITVLTRQQGQLEFDSRLIHRQGDAFKTEIQDIKSSTEYYATVDDIKSDKFTINVLDRPLIRVLQVKLTPPSYTRLPARTGEDNIGDIDAYPGTKVGLHVGSSKPLSQATLVFSDSSAAPLDINGANAEGSFVVHRNKTYHVLLKDADGLPNIDPIEYTIRATPDEFPTAEILSPAKNVDVTQEMKLDLFTRINDDFGFTKLRLAYRLSQSRYEPPAENFTFLDIPLQERNQSPQELWYHWDVSGLHLVPEDALSYYVEVFDNDNVNGPKSGKSETYLLRLPSLEEVFSDVSQAHDQSMDEMQSVSKETQRLRQDIEDLQREMKKNRDKADWQQQKKAQELTQRHDEMKKRLEETTKKLDEMMKKMEENKLLSDETMEKYAELQKLMEQLKSPELQEALKKLQESAKQLSPEEMRQAMEQLKLSEEQFRQSLERTVELLKRIHIEQKIDELIKRAEELQKQQEALKEQTSKTNSSDQQKRDALSQQQKDLQKQAESLEKQAGDLTKKMEEFPKEMPVDQMAKTQQNLEKNQVGQKMSQSAQQMQSGDMQSAQQSQEQSEQSLADFQQQMKDVQKQLQDEQAKQVTREMRKQLENMVELSRRQEALKEETKAMDPNSQRFREGAQQQSEMKNDLGNVAANMAELSKKTFAVSPEMGKEMGDAMKEMQGALDNMEARNPGGSSEQQGESMGSLNRAALMMQNALSGLQGAQSGLGMAGLMGRLGQMAGMQGSINSGTGKAMEMGNGTGNGLTPQQQAEYGRLAGSQGAVQQSLKELAQQAKDAGEYSKLLGDLDRIAQEMQEVQTDLEQGNVNPGTTKKQDHILSRLLDSQRSMRERDYEKRRKAEAGKDIRRASPADIDVSTQEGKNKLREELLKVLEGRYSKDYEELIKKYFDQLEKDEVHQQ